MVHMPQEIEVWHILPAMRRELSKAMVNDLGQSQRATAKLLGVSEPAVSQYLKAKRGKEVKFSKRVIEEIRKSASRIAKDKNLLMAEMKRVCELNEVKLIVCEIHRSECKKLPDGCNICLRR